MFDRIGQPRESLDCLLEERHCLAVGRAGPSIPSCLPEVGHGLLPQRSPHRMVGQPLRMLAQLASVVVLHGLYEGPMQLPTPIVEKALVGDLMGEGMPEGILELWKQARLVEELRISQPGEASS